MTAIDLRILGFVIPPHLKPCVWLAMMPSDSGWFPILASSWACQQPKPVSHPGCLPQTHALPSYMSWWPSHALPGPQPALLSGWSSGTGSGWPCHALPCTALPAQDTLQLPVPWNAREQPAHMCLDMVKLPFLKTFSVNQICGGNKS